MEKTPFRRRIFALSNRTNMLQTISWGEYFTVMGLGFTLYYGWWLVRYYPTLRWGRKGKAESAGPTAAGKPAEKKGKQAAMPTSAEKAGTTAKGMTGMAGEVIGKPDQAVAAIGPATQPIELPLPTPAVIQQPVFLPMLMGDLVNEVRQLIETALTERPKEEELAAAFRQLLAREPYHQLRGTVFEGKIVVRIVRDLEKHGLIAVDAMVVSGWWT